MKLEVLGNKGIERMDAAARRILERTGVLVPHERMPGLLAKAGAKVDRAGQRVRIPGALLDECIGQAGKTFTLYGRDRSSTAPFGQGRRNYNSIAGEASWLEESGKRRLSFILSAAPAFPGFRLRRESGCPDGSIPASRRFPGSSKRRQPPRPPAHRAACRAARARGRPHNGV